MAQSNRQWRIRRKPDGEVSRDNFEWVENALPEPDDGQLLVRSIYLSIDPVQRYWLSENPTFGPPTPVGQIMPGRVWGVVEESRSDRFQKGDLVAGLGGWQAWCLLNAAEAEPVPAWPGVPLLAHTALFSMQALSAYFGLLEIGQAKAGETVVVSAAAGGVGSLVVQIARIQGCRVIGIAGSPEKCRWIQDELGADGSVDYHAPDFARQLQELCPDGVDVYYDNVGGDVLDAVLSLINPRARIASGGFISHYNDTEPAPGPANLNLLTLKQGRMEGFSCFDYVGRAGEAFAAIRQWYDEGRITYRAHLVQGLENAPDTLAGIFHGHNIGKGVIQVSPAPSEEQK
jgi:NADPH-dependent curcumin reductase CurA